VTAANLPALVTYSYAAFRREYGAIVRTSLGVPRGVRLPNPHYGQFTRWPTVIKLHGRQRDSHCLVAMRADGQARRYLPTRRRP